MSKLIRGVAFNSKRKYKTSNQHKIAYSTWKNMIDRCYSKDIHAEYPTYTDCSVADDWLDYQNFADWFYNNKYSRIGYQLDKDLLAPNNKIYSPETCCFVPQEINKLITDSGAARGNYPQGVCFNKSIGKYFASMKINGISKHLGYFESPQKAYEAYRLTKEQYVKNKALDWKDRIDTKVFESLMQWSLSD